MSAALYRTEPTVRLQREYVAGATRAKRGSVRWTYAK